MEVVLKVRRQKVRRRHSVPMYEVMRMCVRTRVHAQLSCL
jgi:hypothetical protein